MADQKLFRKKVLKIVSLIPSGKTRSYKEVAILAGRPSAWRTVGNILNKNYNKDIPCHRVICSNGNPGGYNRGKKRKLGILKREGAIK